MDSDSSDFIDTTYSEDERIEREIRENKEKRKKQDEAMEEKRKLSYETFLEQYSTDPSNIFHLPGLHFYTFTHLKIKLGFNPSEVANVSKKIKFITILKYNGRYWTLGRNTIPFDWLGRIHEMFIGEKTVTDDGLLRVLNKIQAIFLEWSREYEEICEKKMEKYRNGEIEFFDLNSEDEEVYLDEEERNELREKRDKILKRMIPPEKKRPRRKAMKLEKKTKKRNWSPTIHLDSD